MSVRCAETTELTFWPSTAGEVALSSRSNSMGRGRYSWTGQLVNGRIGYSPG